MTLQRSARFHLVFLACAACGSEPGVNEAPSTEAPAPIAGPGRVAPPQALPMPEPELASNEPPSVSEGSGSPPLVVGAAGNGAASAGADSGDGVPTSDAGGAMRDTTHGQGGPVGPTESTSRRGLQYRINAPPGAGAHGLLVLLHGSTASNYEAFVPMMQTVAERYDLIPVSVLAPNGQGWNEGDQVRAAELLHALVQEDLYTGYDIDTARVVFSGQSSGGGFLSSNFVPAHAQDYTGGAFFQCGAAPPNLRFSPDAATRQSFRLHFEITTDDPIWPESYAAALAAYRSAGMALTEDSTKPGGHCQFDQQQVIVDHIDVLLGR
jgi:predicted esterase